MTLKESAKHYLKTWLSVIPVGKDKIPLINWKEYQQRKPTEEEIDKWFEDFPEAQIWAVTGKISWLIVVDVEKWWDISWLPETAISKTWGGWYHYYYRFNSPYKNKTRIKELTDIRWDWGYVVLPPSETTKWKYSWFKKLELTMFPYWLFKEEKKEIEPQKVETEYEWAWEWGRNDAMTRHLWHLIAKIHPTEWDSIAWLMFKEANKKNDPPLDEYELKSIFDSITWAERSSNKERWYKEKLQKEESWEVDEEPDAEVLPFFTSAENDASIWLEKYSTWFPLFDAAFDWWMAEWDVAIIAWATWQGKCLWKWTKIIMFDWSIKNVEDVIVWDKIMWDDSTSRTVLSLARWREQMYKIVPIKWDPYIVNESHILSLKKTWTSNRKWIINKWEIIDISVKEYLEKNKTWKHTHKWYRVWVNFNERKVSIDPYFLWLWLWDWDSRHAWITTNDNEIVEYLKWYARKLWMKFVKLKQFWDRCWRYYISRWFVWAPFKWFSIWKELRIKWLLWNKHIPNEYKNNSRENRLKLLAWLIDSDWSLEYNWYVITQKSEVLSDDILYLSRSLWFSSYKTVVNKQIKSTWFSWKYFRISISWNCNEIPVLLKRKAADIRKQKKDVLVTWINIEKLWIDNYYWFEIDWNKRFLLWDFTVTHNTEMTLTYTYNFASQWIPVLYFSYEVLVWYLLEKFQKMWATADMPIYTPQKCVTGNIWWIDKKIVESKKKYWVKVVVIDHLWFLMPRMRVSESSNWDAILTQMVRDLKSIAIRERIIIILPVHLRKTDDPSMNDIKGSSGIAQEADEVFMIIREKNRDTSSANYYTNHSKIILEKNRKTGRSVQWWFTLINGKFVNDDFYKLN